MVTVERADPRVKRTRQLLERAFMELMEERGFQSISVQDIAERATVNRATFYAHFEDKYALFDHLVEAKFREALASKLSSSCGFTLPNLQLLILTVLEFLGEMRNHCKLSDPDMDQMHRKVRQEVNGFLLRWLTAATPNDGPARRPFSPEAATSVLSWAIFGAAIEWSQGRLEGRATVIADEVLQTLTLGLTHWITIPAGESGQ